MDNTIYNLNLSFLRAAEFSAALQADTIKYIELCGHFYVVNK